ncbi:aspartate--tRNA ligase [bacterium]|nr:aspartate--tRNA ligase [bacterium]
MDNLGDWKRQCSCAALRETDIDKEINLMGWVHTRRDHGGVIFIDLRDREGITQVVFNPEWDKDCHEKARNLKPEYVIAIQGKVRLRPEGMANPKIPTGKIEVMANELKILNKSKVPPIAIEDNINVGEELRLRYRYLDLRRPQMQHNLSLRHRVYQTIRSELSGMGFLEIETPFLTKSTPEGARDYLVPSRLNPGNFYALPQSPQIFKQILMVSGYDRYFQIVKCFRDEDLRADRQPEFTQLDMEMSFVDRKDIMGIIERLLKLIFSLGKGIKFDRPFPCLTYREAIDRFGLDAPDIRFGMELTDISGLVADSGFKIFAQTVAKGGHVKGINAKGAAIMSRTELDGLLEKIRPFGAQGLAWIKIASGELQSPIKKFFTQSQLDSILKRMGGEEGDVLLFVADRPKIVAESLGRLRLILGRRLDLIPRDRLAFVWVTDFPMFEFDEEMGRYVAMHHPFTSPADEDIELLEHAPDRVRAMSYDIVLNGQEIGGGSIRIHRSDLQKRVFDCLSIKPSDARKKFGFLLDALEYGAPPHGGIALGLDRLLAILAGADSIREVIAFPKTQKAVCLMTGAPSEPDHAQLKELHLRTDLVLRAKKHEEPAKSPHSDEGQDEGRP